MAKDTAESKLLKLIEETDAKDKASSPQTAASSDAAVSAAASQVLNSVSAVGVGSIAIPPFLKKILAVFSRSVQPSAGSGLRLVNQILVVLILALGMFFMKDFSRGVKESQSVVSVEVKQKSFDLEGEVLPSVADVANYVAVVSERNIFRPFEKKVEEAKALAPLENQQIKDKLENFKLVGISWFNTPDTATAMIEDKGRAVTFFVKTGDDLSKSSESLTGVSLDVIYADRVEFSYQGQKLMINL